MTPSCVLALNAGSSSLKAAVFEPRTELARHDIELEGRDCRAALDEMLDHFDRSGLPAPDAVGHRVVHGGPRHAQPALVDDDLVTELTELTPLAPLHQGPGLAVIEAARARYPGLPHVACFDTAFHRSLPEVAQRFAIDDKWWHAGVRRYGFHGLSYEYLLETVPETRHGRVVLAHLGSGSSMTALLDGAPKDTTMGLTPTGGLVMATRSGDLDPGVLFYLLRAEDVATVERAVDVEAGLLGMSGTADMRQLLTTRADDARAANAVAVFCQSARKHVGALAAVVGGIDVLVFTGGIGANSPEVRSEICAGLEFLGISVDAELNESGATCISRASAQCQLVVMPTDEEHVIADHVYDLLDSS